MMNLSLNGRLGIRDGPCSIVEVLHSIIQIAEPNLKGSRSRMDNAVSPIDSSVVDG